MALRINRARSFFRIALCAASLIGLSAACTVEEAASDDDDEAVCGDGKVDPGEQCDGSQFGSTTCGTYGFDEGELSCSNSCQVENTACIILDEDLDGLNIHDELQIGTDPLNPDTDTDGVLDGAEVTNGSDPLNQNSWPQGLGMWPNRLNAVIADAVEGGGTVPGQVIWNYLMTDQLGAEIQLWQFYGYKIVIAVSAVWCPPCREAARTAQALWDQHRESGVIFIEQLVDGNTMGVDATQQDVENWANSYQLQFPVVSSDQPLRATSLPTFYVINSDLTVSEKIEGWGGDETITAALGRAH